MTGYSTAFSKGFRAVGGRKVDKKRPHLCGGRPVTMGELPCSNPTVESKDQSCLSVLFASRDESNRSHIGQLGLNSNDIGQVISVRAQPILSLGEIGTLTTVV